MARVWPLTFASKVREFVTPILPLPRLPTPAIVLWLVRIGVVPVPTMKFGPALPMTRVPVPVRVTAPLTLKNGPLPVEASVMVPLLVIVPVRVVFVLLAIWRLPPLVRPLSVLLLLTTVPVPAVISVPPVMVVPLSVTVDPVCALMVAPVLFQHAPLNSR